MKPPPFEYCAPRTVEETVALLARYGSDAKVIAGGQSLMPLLNMRLARPAVLVDMNRIAELESVRRVDGRVTFGALTRQRRLEDDPDIAALLPLLAEMAPYIGHPATRNRGTIGGSIAHADPAAELPCCMLVLGATFTLTGPKGDRRVAAEHFHLGPLTTGLSPDEVLTAIEVPVPPPDTGHAFVEMTRRFGDFALVAAAALVVLDGRGRCRVARVGLAGVAPSPDERQVREALAGNLCRCTGYVNLLRAVMRAAAVMRSREGRT